MGDAEKAMRAADETLHGAQAREAAPPLDIAERRLLETAEFLRAMELTEVADTLKKLGAKAEQDGKATRDSTGEKGDPAKAGTKEPPARQAARNTALADDILAALAEKAGGQDKAADAEAGAADKGLGETLAELREQAGVGKLAGELGQLAELQQKGDQAQTQANDAAGRLDAMAREFREAAQRLEASRAANLAAAQAQAKELQKQLADAGDKPGDKPGGKDGQKDEGAGKKPGAKGDKLGDKPGAQGLAKGDKPGDKPGAQGAGKGDKPGDKPGTQGTAKGDKPGAEGLAKNDQPGKGGDKPEDGKEAGRGGIAGDLETAKEGPGGQPMGRFSKALRSVGDERLHDFSIKLFNAPFSRDSLPLVDAAAERIDELVAALPPSIAPLAATGRVPESRRREVEDYFRNLSDDFGGEKWGAPAAPGQKSE